MSVKSHYYWKRLILYKKINCYIYRKDDIVFHIMTKEYNQLFSPKRQFTVRYKEEEDGGYSGQCLEIPGAISQGETLEELKENMKDAISLILESIKRRSWYTKEKVTNNRSINILKYKSLLLQTRFILLDLKNHNYRQILKVLTNIMAFL